MNGLLVCATKPEWSELKKSLVFERVNSPIPLYQLKNQNIQLLQVGIGPEMAQKNLQAYFGQQTPDWILHFGLSGGLDPQLAVGDCLLAEKILTTHNSINTDPRWNIKITEIGQKNKINFKTGIQFSSDMVLARPTQKKLALEKYHAIGVDMESYWVAEAAQKKQIPYYFLRSVFDTATEDLSPLANANTITPEGQLTPAGLATSLIKNPKLILSLPQYQKKAAIANKKLAQLILDFLNTL